MRSGPGQRPRSSSSQRSGRRKPPKRSSPVVQGTASQPRYLQQALAHYSSRRKVEQWLRAGRIQVNGRPAEPGQRIDDSDRVSLDGQPLRVPAIGSPRLLALHKPEGLICTRHDPEGRPTVYDILPQDGVRWLGVGRLDINSEGLLLFSNDGVLVQGLAHPGSQIEREYSVRVFGRVTEQKCRNMVRGVALDGCKARFHKIVPLGGEGANRWYRVVLLRGMPREVRRIWATQGLQVNRLIRTRYGPCTLPTDSKPGDCWELGGPEFLSLALSAGQRER